MQKRQAARVDKIKRPLKHVFGLCREARNNVGAENDVRPRPADFAAEVDGLLPVMTALHPFQHHVVASLKAEMKSNVAAMQMQESATLNDGQ